MNWHRKGALVAGAALLLSLVAGLIVQVRGLEGRVAALSRPGITTASASVITPNPLVITCQPGEVTPLDVQDGNSAPIFSVGCWSGAGVHGDNFGVDDYKGAADPFHPDVVLSPWTPAGYQAAHPGARTASCTAPGIWLGGGRIYLCRLGRWVKVIG